MNRLTLEERRRMSAARQRARQAMMARVDALAAEGDVFGSDHRGRRQMAKAAMVAALVGGALLAARALEFNLPDSLADALLSRL